LVHKRSDPLIPILGSAVSLVVLGAILLVFYPRVSAWFEKDEGAVVLSLPAPGEVVPLWTCSPRPGVALLIEMLDIAGEAADPALDSMLAGGPYLYLRLSAYHFEGDEPYRIDVPGAGFDSPEGGARLLPAAACLRPDLDAAARSVLAGLGAVGSLDLESGRQGQILLVATGDVSTRTAFLSGSLKFERRAVTRYALAAWHEEPRLQSFLDF
jgi:hypothetical protein